MLCAIFYMHQAGGVCTGVCMCNHMHQMEKTAPAAFCECLITVMITRIHTTAVFSIWKSLPVLLKACIDILALAIYT